MRSPTALFLLSLAAWPVGCSTEVLGGPVAIYRISGNQGPVERSNVVGSVIEDSPAAAAGLLAGDRVMKLGGRPTGDWAAVVGGVTSWGETHQEGDVLEIEWDRGGVRMNASLVPRWISLPGDRRAPMIGIRADTLASAGSKAP